MFIRQNLPYIPFYVSLSRSCQFQCGPWIWNIFQRTNPVHFESQLQIQRVLVEQHFTEFWIWILDPDSTRLFQPWVFWSTTVLSGFWVLHFALCHFQLSAVPVNSRSRSYEEFRFHLSFREFHSGWSANPPADYHRAYPDSDEIPPRQIQIKFRVLFTDTETHNYICRNLNLQIYTIHMQISVSIPDFWPFLSDCYVSEVPVLIFMQTCVFPDRFKVHVHVSQKFCSRQNICSWWDLHLLSQSFRTLNANGFFLQNVKFPCQLETASAKNVNTCVAACDVITLCAL